MRPLTKVKLQIRETQKTYYMYYMITLALYYDVTIWQSNRYDKGRKISCQIIKLKAQK